MRFYVFVSALVFALAAYADGWNPNTKAPNTGSIANTRHNLTLSYLVGNSITPNIMDSFRNQYLEVCVYCHTPHGANSTVAAPLWNRSRPTQPYPVYNQWAPVREDTWPRRNSIVGYYDPATYDQPVSAPGPNSLSCLSCHDGSFSIDTIINMPSRPTGAMAGYSPNPTTSFLDQWDGAAVGGQTVRSNHARLGQANEGGTCLICHNDVQPLNQGRTISFSGFEIAEASAELRNDHPIGVTYPTKNTRPNPNAPAFVNVTNDYNDPATTSDSLGRVSYFFDRNGSGKIDKNEVRLYNSGEGAKVECTSCHDPHGVPSDGDGSKFIPSFLRVSNGINEPVGLCSTCHNK